VYPQTSHTFNYNSYSAACTEAEIDVLTGETEIIRTDILFDCGRRYTLALKAPRVVQYNVELDRVFKFCLYHVA
jgi:xanthine dehydrogenase/oxidase